MNSEFDAIGALIQDYFDGVHHSDTQRLRKIFHPRAHYVCVSDGTLVYYTMDEYFPIVDARPSPASRNEPRQDRILSIEFAGPVSARVTLNCAIAPKFFTDMLTLIKIDGRWQIISKVFHYDLKA
jgi:4-oxalocrotonate tautomerase